MSSGADWTLTPDEIPCETFEEGLQVINQFFEKERRRMAKRKYRNQKEYLKRTFSLSAYYLHGYDPRSENDLRSGGSLERVLPAIA